MRRERVVNVYVPKSAKPGRPQASLKLECGHSVFAWTAEAAKATQAKCWECAELRKELGGGSNLALLRLTLQMAVPMWIHRLLERKYSWPQVLEESRRAGAIVAEKGDVLQFGGGKGKKSTGCAEAFNAMACGLACLSFAEGGADFLGMHFETDSKRLRGECV